MLKIGVTVQFLNMLWPVWMTTSISFGAGCFVPVSLVIDMFPCAAVHNRKVALLGTTDVTLDPNGHFFKDPVGQPSTKCMKPVKSSPNAKTWPCIERCADIWICQTQVQLIICNLIGCSRTEPCNWLSFSLTASLFQWPLVVLWRKNPLLPRRHPTCHRPPSKCL